MRQRVEAGNVNQGWIDGRDDGETFTDFQRRLSDDELGALAGLEPAKKRVAA